MAWVIPISLAYVPGVLIGFLASTLLTVRYRVPPPQPPTGSWREGQWPPVTVVGAARNEERAIVPTLERIAGLAYAGPLEVVLADNNSTDRTAERAQQTAERLGLDYRRIFQPTAGKHHALNTPLESVTTPLVTTVDADTLLHPAALTYLVAQGAFSAYWTEDVRAVGG
jgi:poly-beta-1,6-N-acetyl-D-glucosamine synthase